MIMVTPVCIFIFQPTECFQVAGRGLVFRLPSQIALLAVLTVLALIARRTASSRSR